MGHLLGGETRSKGAGVLCAYQAPTQTYCHVPATLKEFDTCPSINKLILGGFMYTSTLSTD